jgi:hypothetical protein
MNKNHKKLLEQAMTIASEAIYLAGAYSGNDSESVAQLEKQFELLEYEVNEIASFNK